MQLYKEALARGWQLTTKHSFLWLFGLFALFISGNGGEFDIYFRNINSLTSSLSIFNPEFWKNNEWLILIKKMSALGHTNLWLTIILGIIFLIAAAVVIYFIIISQIALMDAASKYPKNKITFHQSFQDSRGYFWPVLLINICSRLVIGAFLMLLAVPFLKIFTSQNYFTYESIYYLMALLILVPVVLIVSFLNKFAINYLVIQKEKLIGSLKKSFKLFINNWLVSLEMALIFFILSLLLGLFVILAIAVLITPFITFSLMSSMANFYTIMMIAILLAVVSVILAASIFSTWQYSSWTYLFIELTKGNREGKLLRILQNKD